MEIQERLKDKKYLKGLKGRVQSRLSGFVWAFVVALLVAAQFAIILLLPMFLRQYTAWFYFLVEFLGILGILALTNDNRSMSYKFAWLCIIVVLPISGYVMFALWGKIGKRNKLNQKIKDQIRKVDRQLDFDEKLLCEFAAKHPVSSRMSRYMQAEGAPIYKNNAARYYQFGEEAFEDIFEDLERAKRFIFIEFFIVAEGSLWDKLHDILKRKIDEGVEVKFLYDDFGALFRTDWKFAAALRQEGFEVEVFNQIHKYVSRLYMNFRDHQKIIVIDGNISYTGGFNIADEYANLIDRFGVWKDAGIRLEGDAVWAMTITFLELWTVCVPSKRIDYDRYRPTKKFPESDMYCHVLRDGPALGPSSFVGNSYKQMIQYAGKKLYVMTPYLILEEAMVETFLEASRRGVDVRILTPFVPDKKHVKLMTEYNYGVLLENGIRIYEYRPGFVHSKVIMNEHCAIVGTINMDYRSFYLHYENGVWVYDEKFIEKVQEDFDRAFKESREISYEEWENRPLWKKAFQHFLQVFGTLV